MFGYRSLYKYIFIKWAYTFLLNAVNNENKSNAYTHYKNYR